MVPPPPFRMQTRGQDNIRPPQRYEGIIEQGDSDEEQYRPPKAPRRVSAYRGKVIEYDPDLPPAAFPTLELGQERKEPTPAPKVTTMRNLPPEQTDRNLPCEEHRPAHSTPNRFSTVSLHHSRFRNSAIPNPTIDTSFHRSRNIQQPTNNSGNPTIPRGMAMMPRIVRPVERPPDQGDQWWDTRSNNMSNPVYANNMRIMERLGARTEDDWNIAEMETSDEETPARTAASTGGRIRRSPQEMAQLWEELSVAFKIDLLDIMEDVYSTRAEAMQGLYLNAVQCQELLHHIEEQNGQIAAEDKAVETLQSETHRILLSRSGEQLKNVTQTGFRNMLEEGLYKTKGPDYYTATSAEIAKAKEYLSYCGQSPDLLGHWNSVVGSSVDGANDGNQRNPKNQGNPNGDESIRAGASSTGQVLPEAAFPTKTNFPVQHSSQSAALYASQIIGNRPVEPQYLAPPSQLSISLNSPYSIVRPMDLHKPSAIPRASEMQTPNITPDSLLPQQGLSHPESVPASVKPDVQEDSGSNEEPPPKRRETATNRRTLAPAGSVLSNNTISAPKASTKSRRRVSYTPKSTVAPANKEEVPIPMTASTNSPQNGTAPSATAGPAARSKSMAPPLKPAPPTTENHSLSINDTVPNTQNKAPRRRKTTTAAADPKAPKPAPAPKASGPSNRRRSAGPATRKTAAGGKPEGKFAPGAGGEDGGAGGNGIINGRS